MSWDPNKLNAIFHSEISSSYLLTLLLNGKNNCISFLSYIHDEDPGFFNPQGFALDGEVKREHSYPGKGSIDVFIPLKDSSGKSVLVLVEVKVHDYFSATRNQVKTYIDAAKASEQGKTADVYCIYLTQFTDKDLSSKEEYRLPNTVQEFRQAKNEYGNHVTHFSWNDFYKFLDSGSCDLSDQTIALLINMQQCWMTKIMEDDLEKNVVITNGSRAFDSFFPGTPKRIDELAVLSVDPKKTKSGDILSIDLTRLNENKLTLVMEVIQNYSDGPDVDKTQSYTTKPETLKKVQEFLAKVADSKECWPLLGFYYQLFDYVIKTHYLLLYGSGTTGFSIKLRTQKKQDISLCTLWNSKTIAFKVSR